VDARCGVERPSNSGDSERMSKEVVTTEEKEEVSFGNRVDDVRENFLCAPSTAVLDDEFNLFSGGGLRIVGPCRYGPIEKRRQEYWNRLTDKETMIIY
jgi:hypothetical protein